MTNNLNLTKLRIELARIDKSHTWLAAQLGYKTKQAYFYHIRKRSTKDVMKIADVLRVDPNDLIVRN